MWKKNCLLLTVSLKNNGWLYMGVSVWFRTRGTYKIWAVSDPATASVWSISKIYHDDLWQFLLHSLPNVVCSRAQLQSQVKLMLKIIYINSYTNCVIYDSLFKFHGMHVLAVTAALWQMWKTYMRKNNDLPIYVDVLILIKDSSKQHVYLPNLSVQIVCHLLWQN